MDSKKRILNAIGKIILVFSFAFLAVKIYQYKSEFSIKDIIYNPRRTLGIVGLVASQTFSLCVNAELYYHLLSANSNEKISKGYIKDIYVKTNIYKYLPGNVMQIVGKNQIAIDTAVEHKEVALATFEEILCFIISAVIVSVIFLKVKIMGVITGVQYGISILLLMIGILLLVAFGLIIIKKKKIRKIDVISIRIMLCMTLSVVIFSIINGFLYSVMLFDIEGFNYGNISLGIGAYSFSWLIGFVTPGAPGGVGVREAVLLKLLESTAEHGQIMVSLVMSRIAYILADLIAFYIYDIYPERTKDSR